VLDDSSDSPAIVDEKERLLDELCEIVEDIDFARGALTASLSTHWVLFPG
jgi:hypothetical protein